jgi:serine/threonine-protein kinase
VDPTPQERALIGETISHYRIVEKIGQGGMGVVYKAEDTSLRRVVALKFLPPDLIGATPEMGRFIHEARAAAALNHPNICTVFEIDENPKQPFIAMAYVAGRNLQDIVEGGPLPLDDALRYASQVARGLEEAHAKGVIHRDIKSANIVVSEKGHAIIMDFGLAKLLGQTRLTQAGTTIGTVSYMSPEQARGEDVDQRADIWSLGVVLYRMVAGRYPFEAAHPSAMMYSIMNEPHTPLTAVRTGVPFELERIVDKALVKDPAERYQHVSDLLVDLKALRKTPSTAGRSAAQTSSPPPARAGKPRRWMWAAFALVVVAASVFLWQQLGRRADRAQSGFVVGERVSIAVLPLSNMSQDDSQQYLADGMTEALIAELAQIHALRVISRTSVMRFRDTTLSIAEIAKQLGVNTIIEGSVLHANGRVRVTAQLIDARTDEHLWAESYERDMADVLALQREVARAIAGEVQVELTPGESTRLTTASAVDPNAYDLYLRAREVWFRRTEADLFRARDMFQRVVEMQPDWAPGYVALANVHSVMAGWGLLPPSETYPRARELGEQALALDPGLGSAWGCLAGVAADYDWKWDEADRYYRKAIDLEPNNESLHQWYAEFLTSQGRFDEALTELDLARQNDPLALVITLTRGWSLSVGGDFAGAIAEAERIAEIDPHFPGVDQLMAESLRGMGQHPRAAEYLGKMYEAQVPGAAASIMKGFERDGMAGAIHVIINGLKQASRSRYVSPAGIGFYFASIGEADSAMVWLQRGYQDRAYPMSTMAVSLYCKPIHDDPRFKDLLARMKLDHITPRYRR